MPWRVRDQEGLRRHLVPIGGVFASAEATVARTVLGSCIAVCLRDPIAGVGGMNHFMLPAGGVSESTYARSRYGVHAMELLINACMKAGADRRMLEAKVFGGGHVLRMQEHTNNVPQSNIRFVLEFLNVECIPIRAEDLGGYAARDVYFFTDSGRVLLKRLSPTGTVNREEIAALEREERAARDRNALRTDDNVTLF